MWCSCGFTTCCLVFANNKSARAIPRILCGLGWLPIEVYHEYLKLLNCRNKSEEFTSRNYLLFVISAVQIFPRLLSIFTSFIPRFFFFLSHTHTTTPVAQVIRGLGRGNYPPLNLTWLGKVLFKIIAQVKSSTQILPTTESENSLRMPPHSKAQFAPLSYTMDWQGFDTHIPLLAAV